MHIIKKKGGLLTLKLQSTVLFTDQFYVVCLGLERTDN